MNKLLKRYMSLFKKETATIPTFSYTVTISSTSYSLPVITTIPDTMIVEWGDGSSGSFANTASVSHIYPSTGTYQIKIRHSDGLNKMPRVKFNTIINLISVDTPLLTQYSADTLNTSAYEMFYACTNLTSIPNGLFDSNPQLINFANSFYNCPKLNNLPNALFNKNSNANNFNQTFGSCTALTSVPEGLFKNNFLVNNFASCFSGCVKLTLNKNIFCNEDTEMSTRFANIKPDFSSCFNVNSFSGIKGTSPQLWKYTYLSAPTTTNCFRNTSIPNQITNAVNVPTAWKG